MTTANSIDYKLLTILKKILTYDQPHNLRQVINIKANCIKISISISISISIIIGIVIGIISLASYNYTYHILQSF